MLHAAVALTELAFCHLMPAGQPNLLLLRALVEPEMLLLLLLLCQRCPLAYANQRCRLLWQR
jgi:hypothetical protein